jgi:hypothetical protein
MAPPHTFLAGYAQQAADLLRPTRYPGPMLRYRLGIAVLFGAAAWAQQFKVASIKPSDPDHVAAQTFFAPEGNFRR